MKASTKGFLILVVLASVLIVAWHFLAPLMEERRVDRTSDAAKIKEEVTLAGDSWLGYCILRSPEFKKLMRQEGINPKWIDDNAQYQERLQKFSRGEYDFIVATVDSYILNAALFKPAFPGVIICVIDESKGGDAIIAKTTVPDLNGLNNPSLKIALTPASPSEFLLKAVASHFNVTNLSLNTAWKVETDGAEGAYKALIKGSVEVAVIWEPYVSKALTQPEFHKLLGTEKTRGLIVDILVAHRDVVTHSPEVVVHLLKSYFQALQHYRREQEYFEELAAADTREKKAVARKMLEGIKFVNFTENCQEWYGLSASAAMVREQLSTAIESTISILIDHGDLGEDPTQANPYLLMNSTALETLYSSGALSVHSKFTIPSQTGPDQKVDFSSLNDTDWNHLKIVGTLKIRPIVFQSSTPLLSISGKKEVDRAAEVINHYPHFRILIKGHTSPSGDPEANKELSQQRADAVRKYLISVHDIAAVRIKAIGMGSQEPLPRKPNESFRGYKLRLQRVEFIFLEESV